jgi:hypothetical protein
LVQKVLSIRVHGIIRLKELTMGTPKEKYERAIDILKDYYMFMWEDDEAIHFKHKYTRQYIKIEKVGL